MLTALVVMLRSFALICGGHRAVALENLALRQSFVTVQAADFPECDHVALADALHASGRWRVFRRAA